MEKKGASIEQEREKMYSMAVTLEMEEMANYREAAMRKDRKRINKVSDQADEEWIKMQKNKKMQAEE